MSKNIYYFFKKHYVIAILFFIVAIGIFLRAYNFDDWLFFQGDQVRDVLVARKAVENGPGWLPLLGPKAGGTFLRLGPIFYYFQYLSALFFGIESPKTLAYPDLLFSVLTIPLFFIFLKEFFSKNWSLALSATYAVCFFAVQYSRFAWNPNSLPFFNLLFFFFLLKFFTAENRKREILWMALAGVAYAIASQLHFVGLLGLPLAFFGIIFAQKFILKKFEWVWLKYALIMILVLAFFYVPVILSETSTGGNNTLNFLSSIGGKSSDAAIWDLFKEDILNFSKYFFIILTGVIDAYRSTALLSGMAIISAGVIAAVFIFRQESDYKKKIFLIIILVWFFAYAVSYLPLATELQPRHFLTILPIPFIFIGLIGTVLRDFFIAKYKFIVPLVLFLAPVAANGYSMNIWFSEIKNSQITQTTPRKSGMLKSVGGESWWHLKKTAGFISADCEKGNISISPPKKSYRGLIDYSMKNAGETRPYSIKWNSIKYKPDTCYYAVHFSKNKYNDRHFSGDVRKIKTTAFGDMSVTKFEIEQDEVNEKGEVRNPFRKEKDINPNKNTSDENNDKEDNNKEEDNLFLNFDLGDVKRKNRVYWKDLFE